jgi:hypothetical protein
MPTFTDGFNGYYGDSAFIYYSSFSTAPICTAFLVFFDCLSNLSLPHLLRCSRVEESNPPPPLSMAGRDPSTQTLPRLPLLGHPLKTDDGENLHGDMILVLDRGWRVV